MGRWGRRRRMGPSSSVLLLPLLLLAARQLRVSGDDDSVAAGRRVVLEVRPSKLPGAGLGLFLAPDSAVVPKGAILAKFDGVDIDPHSDGAWRALGAEGRSALLTLPSTGDDHHGRRLVVRVGEEWKGHVPARVEAGSAVGQLVNDPGAHLLLHATMGPRLAEEEEEEDEGEGRRRTRSGVARALQAYLTAAPNHANVNFTSDPDFASRQGGGWPLQSTREINPGEELLLTYGAHNWLYKVMNNAASSPLVRLLVYLAILDATSGSDPDGPLPMLGKISVRTDGTPVLATTGEEADEHTCADFMKQVLGFSAPHKLKLRGRRMTRALTAGSEGGSWKALLTDMVRQLSGDEGEEEEEEKGQPPE